MKLCIINKAIQVSIIELCMNFKISPWGLAMQLVTKPWGCAAQGDANKLMTPEDYNNKIKKILFMNIFNNIITCTY